MKFIGVYDFNDQGFIDLQFFLVRIDGCEEHPHLVGREALFEARSALVKIEKS